MNLPTIDPSTGLMTHLPGTRREFRAARRVHLARTFSRLADQYADPIERELLRMVADDSRARAARIRQDRRNEPGRIDPRPRAPRRPWPLRRRRDHQVSNTTRLVDFVRFVKQQANRDDPVGHLARHLRADEGLSPRIKTRDGIRRHLIRRGATRESLAALDAAWGEYSRGIEMAGAGSSGGA